ncbi:MAG: hypothetical protein J6V94_02875 [Lachnospiraceae bacterium]|nr:hypothetical protein [Lachnospiraceae bacterium]MBP5762237.1 hypothetical protein [Lachnospiraceae bacterium]
MKKLIGRIVSLITVFVLCFSVQGCSGAGTINPEMTVTIDGVDFALDCKVSDILDAGFRVVRYDSGMKDDLPSVGARELISKFYSIVRQDGTETNISVNIYNKSYNEAEAADCYVYEFVYDASIFPEDTPHADVTFNGINMHYADMASVVSELEEQGFKFKEEDKTEFFRENDPYADRLLSAKGLMGCNLRIDCDYDYETGAKPITGFDLTLKLDYEIE